MSDEQAPLTGPDLKEGIAAADVLEGKPLLGHADGEPVIVTRVGTDVFAVGAKCTHYGGPLAEGLVVGDTIRCPWHHAAFSLRTGAPVRPPALANLPCWRVEEGEGKIRVTSRRSKPAHLAPATSQARPSNGAPLSVVIIGGGAAGAVAAETLRREGYTGRVVIVEAGQATPTDRPNLSKDYLAGNAPEEWIPLHPDSYYADNDIEILLGHDVKAIDAKARTVTMQDGSSLPYGALLLATGATPVTLDMPDAGQKIHYLRTLADSRAIIAAAAKARRAVVIGSSFIGLEVAASLRTRGLEVTVVGLEERPLERVLGAELGDFVRAVHEEHGVEFRLGQSVKGVGPSSVTLSSGEEVAADLVVAGIGVRPNVALAEAAGIATDRGIMVDEFLETSEPGIFAAGDIVRFPYRDSSELIRVEHWVVAERQAQTAARNIVSGGNGRGERFDAVPFFWSQHYDVVINYVGHAAKWDTLDIEGDIAGRDCAVTYRANGKTLAVATIFRDQTSLEAELALERGTQPEIG
ncbi:MAG TPA: FAD-dependent oxidoreductase [Gemmatimonadales bacterium]|nr:FAD-dependent oxidoreductase [Gemmatimonadales bacterium]